MKLLRTGLVAGALWAAAGFAWAGSSIVVGLQQEPPHLDPTSASAGAIDQVLYGNVFEGLTRIGPTGAVTPGLAESWTISEDGTVYIFKLRYGALFHDGTELDSRDVKFTLDRARDDNSQNAQKSLFDGIEEVEAMSPLLVKVTLSEPSGDFLFNLAWGDAVIVAPESIGDIKQKPIGTGAFKFKDWIVGDRIELERNEEYWGEAAKLDMAFFKFIESPFDATRALKNGDVDAFPAFPDLGKLSQFETDPAFQVLVGNTEGETILAMNNKQSPFDDVRVRRAVTLALDRKAIIADAMDGLGTPIGSHFAPHHPDYVDLTKTSPYDPALSLALLAEAGYENGFSTTLKIPPPEYAQRSAGVIAEQLRAVGIEVEITKLEWAEWLEQVFNGKDYGLTILSHPEPMDFRIYAKPDYYFQYDSIKFRAVMTELDIEQDPQRRSDWLAAAQRVIAEDFVNAFLFQMPTVTIANARLRGLWRHAPTQATDLTRVYWSE